MRLTSGRYIIYNRILSPERTKLAVTFNGFKRTVSVNPLTRSRNQIWIVDDQGDGYYTFHADSHPNLEVHIWLHNGGKYIQTLTHAGVLWTVTEQFGSGGYTIHQHLEGMGLNEWLYWSVGSPEYGYYNSNEDIKLAGKDEGMNSHWVFEKVR